MALTKVQTGGLAADSVDNTILDVAGNYAFTGTVTGAGLSSPIGNSVTVTSEGGAATTSLPEGLAKVVCTFNGTSGSATVRTSFNVSSTDDDAKGSYGVNFTSAMSGTEFTAVGSTIGDSGTGFRVGSVVSGLAANTTSSINFSSAETDGSVDYRDFTHINTLVHGDLA